MINTFIYNVNYFYFFPQNKYIYLQFFALIIGVYFFFLYFIFFSFILKLKTIL